MNNLLKAAALLPLHLVFLAALGCSPTSPAPAATEHDEPEALARTEFTDRVENFFEYEPLHAGKPSQFRIHLTDLSDGSPVEQAKVSLTVRRPARNCKRIGDCRQGWKSHRNLCRGGHHRAGRRLRHRVSYQERQARRTVAIDGLQGGMNHEEANHSPDLFCLSRDIDVSDCAAAAVRLSLQSVVDMYIQNNLDLQAARSG